MFQYFNWMNNEQQYEIMALFDIVLNFKFFTIVLTF